MTRRIERYAESASGRVLLAICAATVIAAGCKAKSPPATTGSAAMLAMANFSSTDSTRIDGLTKALGWSESWLIPAYGDQQRLNDGSNAYGPIASVFGNPNLGSIDSAAFATDSGIVVAVVYVDSSSVTLPTTYTSVGLDTGAVCLIAKKKPSWTAFTTRATGTTCPRTPTIKTLTVKATTPFTSPDSIPITARFEQAGDSVNTIFGVRCFSHWCNIAASASDTVATAPQQALGAGNASHKSNVVPGWFDDQRLAMRTGGPSTPLKPTMRASLVPNDTIAMWTLADYNVASGLRVAQIFVTGTAVAKYAGTGMHAGANTLFMRLSSASAGLACINHTVNGCPHPISISRRAHSMSVPAVARWGWSDNDEDIWVACDGACCWVSGTGVGGSGDSTGAH